MTHKAGYDANCESDEIFHIANITFKEIRHQYKQFPTFYNGEYIE